MFVVKILFYEILKSWLDFLESSINILSSFRTSENNFARCKDEQTYLRFEHVIDQAWEGVRVEVAIGGMFTLVKTFQLDLKID